MNKLISIFARSNNNVIGNNNKMLWRISEDFKHFKDTTMGCPMIMGRKTFESLPGILPGREHIILTRNKDYGLNITDKNVKIFYTIGDIFKYSVNQNYNTVFVIGGGEIYSLFENYVDEFIITTIDRNFEGDTTYKPDLTGFSLYELHCHNFRDKISGNTLPVRFESYQKKI